jgi:uncharacterized OsmC-like protein
MIGFVAAIALAGCASAPPRFNLAPKDRVKVRDVTVSVQQRGVEAYAQVVATDGLIRVYDDFEDIDILREAIETSTGCSVENQTTREGTMLADLAC